MSEAATIIDQRARRFLDGLATPPGGAQSVSFDAGQWRVDGVVKPFLAYEEPLDINWSAELEQLHEESSRDHFLDVATRHRLLDGVLDSTPTGGVIVDIGCSTGHLLEDLCRERPDAFAVGVDVVAAGLHKAHERVPDAALMLADVCHLPMADGCADGIVSANVLEHVADDRRALRELGRMLVPGGRAALVVPAGPRLYDYYDAFLGHERRYRRGELAAKGREAGLRVVLDAFIGSLIYPAFWAVKKTNRIRFRNPSASRTEQLVRHNIHTTQGSSLGSATMRIERALLSRHISIPFGIRTLTVLEKPT